MKKTVFVAQVFALLAMLPLVVVLQINHVSPQRSAPFEQVDNTENTIIALPAKAASKISEETLTVSLETIPLKTTD